MSGSLSITVFILSVNLFLFFLPLMKEKFANNEILNMIIKHSIYVIALYLAVLNSSIMHTIVVNSTLPLTREFTTYIWLFGTAGYIMITILMLKTLIQALTMYKLNKEQKRLGYET